MLECFSLFQPHTPQAGGCLTVSVWAGARAAEEKFPVMVWIHDGGFVFDGGGEKETKDNHLA